MYIPTIHVDPLHTKFIAACTKNAKIKKRAEELLEKDKLFSLKNNKDGSLTLFYTDETLDLIYEANGV